MQPASGDLRRRTRVARQVLSPPVCNVIIHILRMDRSLDARLLSSFQDMIGTVVCFINASVSHFISWTKIIRSEGVNKKRLQEGT